MTPFADLTAVAAPLPRPNLDTDQILPARYLSLDRDKGTMGDVLFRDLRFTQDGAEREDFVLNQTPYRNAKIIVAERNFGCGSSREQAVWTIYDYGIRAMIAPSFGDIFRNNALKNGLLPIVLPEPAVIRLLGMLVERPGAEIGVNLASQAVTLPDGSRHAFDIDTFAKECMVNGLDELGYTLSLKDRIADFETNFGRSGT